MPHTCTLSDDIVFEGAFGVFWQSSYTGTSLRDLTQAEGLSSAALFRRFTDKDGLFVKCCAAVRLRDWWSVSPVSLPPWFRSAPFAAF